MPRTTLATQKCPIHSDMAKDEADPKPNGDSPGSHDAGESSGEARVRSYYRALDEQDYDLLASLLSPDFVHDRPDQTIEGRETFVTFMRDERPTTNTTHPLAEIYHTDGSSELVARGTLRAADETPLVRFVDVFHFERDAICRIETFTA